MSTETEVSKMSYCPTSFDLATSFDLIPLDVSLSGF